MDKSWNENLAEMMISVGCPIDHAEQFEVRLLKEAYKKYRRQMNDQYADSFSHKYCLIGWYSGKISCVSGFTTEAEFKGACHNLAHAL